MNFKSLYKRVSVGVLRVMRSCTPHASQNRLGRHKVKSWGELSSEERLVEYEAMFKTEQFLDGYEDFKKQKRASLSAMPSPSQQTIPGS